MRRVALIITTIDQRQMGDFSVDVQNYIDFLRSPIGGAWEDGNIEHIKCAYSPRHLEDVLNSFYKKTGADYALLIYCGRGRFYPGDVAPHFASSEKDENFLDYQLLLPKTWRVGRTAQQIVFPSDLAPSRRTIIFDFCRPLRTFTPGIGLISRAGHLGDRELVVNARKAYFTALRNSQEGVTVLLSCSAGQMSLSDSMGGGAYSWALLTNAAKWAKNTPVGSTLSVVEAHQLADTTIRSRPWGVHPTLFRVAGTSPLAGHTLPTPSIPFASYHSSSGLNFPFAVSIAT